MRRLAIRLVVVVAALLVVSQLVLLPYLEKRVAESVAPAARNVDSQIGGSPSAPLTQVVAMAF